MPEEKISYRCAANKCTHAYISKRNPNDENKNQGFFRFPERDPERRKAWSEIMEMPPVSTRVYLCDVHFEEKAFTNTGKTRLNNIAVPKSSKNFLL